ncbi:MAG TPA: hypothetical protein VIM34_11045 [Burkholderiaceae bacterium]
MDTPPLIYRFVYRAPGRQALGRATLGYCGQRTARIETFGSVVASSAAERSRWLDQSRAVGSRLIHGALSPAQRGGQRLFAWFAALRLQFYPMTWIAYTVGALAASAGKPLSMTPYLLGYLTLFLLEAATVFLNDWFDFDSDRRNRNAGLFTGGSRVLVDGRLDRAAMRKGIGLSILGAASALIALLAAPGWIGQRDRRAVHHVRLARHGLHRPAAEVLAPRARRNQCGDHPQRRRHHGRLRGARRRLDGQPPWLLALPLGVSVLPSILLAGCPDREADAAAAKRTLVVILGKRGAMRLAMAASLAALLSLAREDMAALLGWSAAGGAVHAVWLLRRLRRFTAGEMPERIDGAIVLALTFILWFCVPPLIALTRASGS